MTQAEAKDYRILVLPSGGGAGRIPAYILKKLEEETGKQTFELFDEFWVSSIGALTATLLTTPKENSEKPKSAGEVADYIDTLFNNVRDSSSLPNLYYNGRDVLTDFENEIGTDLFLKDTLKPLRVMCSKTTDSFCNWRSIVNRTKNELALYSTQQDQDCKLSSVVCGSCCIFLQSPVKLERENGECEYLGDAGDEFYGVGKMNPLFPVLEQFSESINPDDQVTVFFLSNGWINLHPSWDHSELMSHGREVIHNGTSINLFNIRVDWKPEIDKWIQEENSWASKAASWGKWTRHNIASAFMPTESFVRSAEAATKTLEFQTMVRFLKSNPNPR